MNGAWTCPGCRQTSTQFACDRCGIRRNVISASQQTAGPLFDAVETLFFELLEFRRGYTGDEAEYVPQVDAIEQLLRSENMDRVLRANWVIRDAVRHLLYSALNGANDFSFRSGLMDVGSVAMYTILVDRLSARLATYDAEKSIQRPIATAVPRQGRDWSCPICSKHITGGRTSCECGCDFNAVAYSQSSEVYALYSELEDLFFRGLDLACASMSSHERRKQVIYLQKDVDKVLKGSSIQKIEDKNWRVRSIIGELFAQLYDGKTTITYSGSDLTDVNSSGLCAMMVRRLEGRRLELLPTNPAYKEVRIEVVHKERDEEENYEPFSEQTFSVHANTKRFLDHHRKLFLAISRHLAEGADAQTWVCCC